MVAVGAAPRGANEVPAARRGAEGASDLPAEWLDATPAAAPAAPTDAAAGAADERSVSGFVVDLEVSAVVAKSLGVEDPVVPVGAVVPVDVALAPVPVAAAAPADGAVANSLSLAGAVYT